MSRKKVKLSYISKDSLRKTSFKKRRRGLIKKVNELSTLCGITSCAIIYSPFDPIPEVWPSNSGVESVISKFRALPEMDQQKNMVDQESYLREKITKVCEKFNRQWKENRELEITEVMFQSLIGNMRNFRLNILDINDLSYLIDQYVKKLNRREEVLQNPGMENGESSQHQQFLQDPNQSQQQQFLQDPNQSQQQQFLQYPNQSQQQMFMEMNQMGFPLVDHNNYNQHQMPTSSAAVTSSTTNYVWFP